MKYEWTRLTIWWDSRSKIHPIESVYDALTGRFRDVARRAILEAPKHEPVSLIVMAIRDFDPGDCWQALSPIFEGTDASMVWQSGDHLPMAWRLNSAAESELRPPPEAGPFSPVHPDLLKASSGKPPAKEGTQADTGGPEGP